MMPTMIEPSVTPCFAAGTAIACERPATWRIETLSGSLHVCDRHLRLVEVKCEREGLAPRVVPEWVVVEEPQGALPIHA